MINTQFQHTWIHVSMWLEMLDFLTVTIYHSITPTLLHRALYVVIIVHSGVITSDNKINVL